VTRARQVVLIALAIIVVAFVVTWLSIPSRGGDSVGLPALLFAHGLTHKDCVSRRPASSLGVLVAWHEAPPPIACPRLVDKHRIDARGIDALKERIAIFFGGAAAVVILVGLAFGAASRPEARTT
jgi:hypothetical protein